MIALKIRFLAGKFHATQWGRHVNEGVPEWPPAPWRILRTLVSSWKARLDEIPTEVALRVLRSLAECPEYALPAATVSHTRHYMPWDKKHPGHTTLVFDTFVALSPEASVTMVWPHAALTAADLQVLSRLVSLVGYLGRAESWCEMELLSEDATAIAVMQINCRPLGTQELQAGQEIVRVLCLDPAAAFENTHTPKTSVSVGKGKAKVTTEHPQYDPDWHLCGETLWLHQEKWANPPGSRWIRYTRPADCFKITRKPTKPRSTGPRPQVIRFVLDSTVLPLLTSTLPVAEAARRNLMGIYGRQAERLTGSRSASAIFAGKSADGQALQHHGHAYFLPTDEDGDGRLDHLTLVAELGFGPDEMRALDALREIKSHDRQESGHRLHVLLMATGQAEQISAGPLASAATWTSVTPYLAHRHPKNSGTRKDTPEELSSQETFLLARLREDLARFLVRRPDLQDIDLAQIIISPCQDENEVFRLGPQLKRPIEFQRFRQKQGDDGGKRRCGAFQVTFPRAIKGPLCLGHSFHFGMGLFLPAPFSVVEKVLIAL